MSEEFVFINRVSGMVIFRGNLEDFKNTWPAAGYFGINIQGFLKTYANTSGCDMYTKV